MKKAMISIFLVAVMLLAVPAQFAAAEEEYPAEISPVDIVSEEEPAEPAPATEESPETDVTTGTGGSDEQPETAVEEEPALPAEDGSYQDTEKSIVNQIITTGMSDYDKLVAITKYAADHYSYSTNYSASQLINYGSGSCVANTYFILGLCKLVGIEAWYRSANRDPGAASQHVCAIAKIGSSYYTADSGYGGSAPRSFDVTERPGGFSVKNGVMYQYDGTGVEHLIVPAQSGQAVVRKRSGTTTNSSETITQIGYSGSQCFSFGGATGLKSITLPATVKTVTGTAFKGCKDLENIYVDAANPYFTSIDGVLYSKDLTRLVCVPAKKTSIIMPNTVTKQDSDAFYGGKIPVTISSGTTPFNDVTDQWFGYH